MDKRRSITLGVRLSQAERESIERAAARELRRPSDYIRAIVLKHIAEEGEKERKAEGQ